VRRIGRLETVLLLVCIIVVASCLRFVGLGWGEGQAIHPDEEFLRQVTAAVALPDGLSQYFDTENSPLNPHNRGYGFFVYGTLPLFVTRLVAEGLDRGCEPPYGLAARLLAPLLIGRPVEECWVGMFSGAGARMVGRALAALFDLGSLLFVFFAGQRLRSRRTGLLAALLYGLAVLPIQQAHFFAVDAFANFFVAATLYLAVRAAQTGGWVAFGLAGLTTGLGMACKISVWPLGLLVALAGGTRWRLAPRPGGIVGRVVLAGVMALLAFRVAQPYAFMGPGFFGLSLNPRWLDNMAEVHMLMSGSVDTYPGHQWTNRTPLLFPWVNMVFWGLGLPLGLVAWGGWAAAGVDLLRRPPYRSYLWLVWAWATGYFAYQGSQWVKAMRYLLPVYPAFVLLAAWLVEWLWVGRGGGEGDRQDRPAGGRARRVVAAVVGGMAVVGALLWALAFTSVYTRPHTRIAASRWIFENVPTAATVRLHTAGGECSVPVVIPAGTVHADGAPVVTPFRVTEEGDLVGVTLNYVVDPQGDPEPELVRVAVAADGAGQGVLAEAARGLIPPSGRRGEAYDFPLGPEHLAAGTTYYLVTEVTDGGPVQLFSSVLATEHWDWAPPLRIDGYDPFGGMYRGLSTSSDGTLQLYHDDTPEKRASMLDWLDEADYIIIGSNRLYASIPRLPTRYPLTIAYYQALFSGELGFELVADFTSYPAIGPFQFPDTEEPFPVPSASYQYRAAPVSVPLPPAEEAFSVYDHPRVLIFRKTPAYSRARAEEVLDPSLLDHVVWVTPREATRGGGREPVFDPETWAQQQAGGTWSEMFDRDGLLNRSPFLAALAWYLAVAVLGWAAFPLLFVALPRLQDRGYGLARALGLLVVGYLTWLAASLRLLPNTRGTVALAVLLLAAGGAAIVWWQRRALRDFLRRRRRVVLVYEGLFLLLFVVWAWVRALNPDLWHAVVGGEKPMDFAYLNAVIKSTWFPPYDPWFAGGYINYYYFGFVLVGSLAKLLGIMPSIAYNLALALFYALTGGAAFCVAFNLAGRGDGEPSARSYVAGLLAVLFVLVLGNLGEVRLLISGFLLVAGPPTFESTIPGLPELVQVLRGLAMVLRGASLPFRPETPYWDPTRMIPADESGVGPITEFPAFTFLYGDLHAHLLALPYTLIVLALALAWARGAGRREGGRPRVLSLLIGGLVVGSLRAVNTWDYPTYLLVGLFGLLLGVGLSRRRVWPLLWQGGLLVGGSVLFFLPYIQNYIPAYTRVRVWQGPRTPLHVYVLLVGQFLFPLLTLMAVEGRGLLRSAFFLKERTLRLALAMGVVGLLLISLALGVYGVPVALVALPVGAAAAALAVEARAPVERRMVWLALGAAMGLALAVEIVVLEGDIGRMNTVFKFYFQIWTLLAVGTAAAVVWLAERMRGWTEGGRQVWWGVMGVLLFGMALFPAMSIPAKVKDRFTDATGPTLDGMAYIQYARTWDVAGEVDLSPDYGGIVWLQENVQGSPVILEGLGAREYLWGNRISIYTGLPTVVGWRWHQVQQRMAANPGQVEQRHLDVNECYGTMDPDRAWQIIQKYGVRYIYIGPYERLYYDPRGLAKFGTMAADGRLRVVYNQGGVKIYEVVR